MTTTMTPTTTMIPTTTMTPMTTTMVPTTTTMIPTTTTITPITNTIIPTTTTIIPTTTMVPRINSLQEYTSVSDVTKNFILDLQNNNITDGTPIFERNYNPARINNLINPQDVLNQNYDWNPSWNPSLGITNIRDPRYELGEQYRPPNIESQYPQINDSQINIDRDNVIKDILQYLNLPNPNVKVPTYILKYKFTEPVFITSLVLKNGLDGNSYPNRIYVYLYDKSAKIITKILSKTNFNNNTRNEQILNFDSQYYGVADTDIYVVLCNDYDCKPYSQDNYLNGLNIRNLYFEGKIINYYCIDRVGGGGAKIERIRAKCIDSSYNSTGNTSRSKCLSSIVDSKCTP